VKGKIINMEKTIKELKSLVEKYYELFKNISAKDFKAKSKPSKWSKQEVVGHLIDSAQNNIRRFIVGQYEEQPHIVYQQDFWVQSNNYQNVNDVIDLWRLINLQICNILEAMPKENYSRICNTGKGKPELHSIDWLADDYVKHMKHHINQIIPDSFDLKYP